jgi:hypothetical protein
MLRGTLDITERDTAALFRADAITLGTLPSGSRRPDAPALDDNNRDEYDEQNFERNPTRDRTTRPRRKLTSDQEQLALKSGYYNIDEATIQGVENSNNGGGANAERIALQRSASMSSTPSWLTNPLGAVGNMLTNAWNSATEYGGRIWNNVTQTFDKYVMQPLGQFGESIKSGFNNLVAEPFSKYIGQPVSNFAGAVADKFSTHIGEPVASTFNSYVSEPVANAWNATKNFFTGAEPQPAQTATAPAQDTAVQPAEHKPSALAQPLAGDKSNPTTGWSLTGMFHSATNALGITEDDPAPAITRPAPAIHLAHGR